MKTQVFRHVSPVVWQCALLISALGGVGCGEATDLAPSSAAARVTTALSPTAVDWTVKVTTQTARLEPDDTGCLKATATVFSAGQTLEVLASDGIFYLLDEDGGIVRASDVTEQTRPDPLRTAGRIGEVAITTTRSHYDAAGCPQAGDELLEHTPIEALARSYDSSYRGYVVISTDLSLAPVRHINAEGWVYPWHSSFQLIKPVEGGFVIGGAVLISPDTLLTARHMRVDETWCYSTKPNTGESWYGGQAVCGNIVGPAEEHPDDVDAALVTLRVPEVGPVAKIRERKLAAGENFYTSKWSWLHQNAMADSTVKEVDNDNAFCLRWPASSSYISTDYILGGGDSGGPAWVGDELIGLVHGEKCYMGREKIIWMRSGEPPAHVLVNVLGIYDFVELGL